MPVGGVICRRLQAGDLGAASSADLISLALDSALRMLGSSEPNSKVMSLLQCWQLTWKPGLTFCARSRNTWEHFVHLILTLSSIIEFHLKAHPLMRTLR